MDNYIPEGLQPRKTAGLAKRFANSSLLTAEDVKQGIHRPVIAAAGYAMGAGQEEVSLQPRKQ